MSSDTRERGAFASWRRLSTPLPPALSRTHHRSGLSSKCPLVFLLPVHDGAVGRTSRPPSQWAALPRCHQRAGLCQPPAWKQRMPRGCCGGLPRQETSAALPGGACTGNGLVGVGPGGTEGGPFSLFIQGCWAGLPTVDHSSRCSMVSTGAFLDLSSFLQAAGRCQQPTEADHCRQWI